MLLLLLFLGATLTYAAPVKWSLTPYTHISRGEKLTDLLRDFCSSQGLNVIMSDKIKGKVNGRFISIPPRQFLERISETYGLIWYYDGATIYIYQSNEVQSKIISLDHLDYENFKEVLDQLEIADKRFTLKAIEEKGIVYVVGPERYVGLVSETATLLDAKTGQDIRAQRSQSIIKIFPLKYAWADDLSYTFMDKQVTVPGVATMLNNLLAGKTTAEVGNGKKEVQLTRTVGKLKGKGLIAVGQEANKGPNKVQAEDKSGLPELDQKTAVVSPEAFIQADTRLNAVIIRDIEEKMPHYEEVISLLDVPVGLVQIQATIVDVNTDFLRDLGINWRFRTKQRGKDRGEGGFEADENLAFDSKKLVLGKGLNLATIVGDAEKYFLARIQALEENGEANVLSRPSVLTLNNVEAVLETSQTFYVRVAGDEEVDLFDVTAGILLKVTPHIIEEESGLKIKLAVSIEDGSLLDTKVDQIPVVQKSTINTQAVIKENESLLVGGHYHESKSEAVNMIPVLGKIPLIGVIFRKKQIETKKTERMFLITPKIVTHDAYPAVELPKKLKTLESEKEE